MQITNGSGINDQYTIYPMHAKRINNESSFKLYRMLKIENVPMDNCYKYLDVMCFPDISRMLMDNEKIETLHCTDYLFVRIDIETQ